VLGSAGLLDLVCRARDGGRHEQLSSIALCLARERLAYASPLADLAFAMQGLGSYPISLKGDDAQRAQNLPGVRAGTRVTGFALTEPGAGTDLGGISTTARREGDSYILDGEKCFISNAGVADVYTLFALTAPDAPRRRLSAFLLPADADGLRVKKQHVLGGHPIGELKLRSVKLPLSARLGDEGDGMGAALATLHRFRTTVGAAAVGFAQRALDEALGHVKEREQFGAPLSELAMVLARLGQMAVEVTSARLMVFEAASVADRGEDRAAVSRSASMAKLYATEAAQRVVDSAVQLLGGRGVLTDSVVGRLYQEVRALRIYEGTNDVHLSLIARDLLSRG
jgi:acyl-CoA dehydrogenase